MAIDRISINLIDLVVRGVSFQQNVSSSPDNADEYSFRGFPNKSVNISLTHDLRVRSGQADLRVFEDRDQDARLDVGEPSVAASTQKFGADEFINFRATSGFPYLIGVVNSRADAPRGSVFYTLKVNLSDIGTANPLTGKEIQLGTLSQDLVRRNTISDKDTADNFAFTLDESSSLNIAVRELGRKKGDVNIRVVRDFDSDGFVDKNEIVARGTSVGNKNVDSITNLKGAGDYILQVCQSKGNTQFEVNFDHVAI